MSIRYKDYYRILKIPRNASPQMVQSAFRKLARLYHPDLNKSFLAEERFKSINEAYEVLKDPEKRKQYDALGPGWQEGQEFSPPPNSSKDFSSSKGKTNGRQKTGKTSSGFSDFFESLFGFGTFRSRPEKKHREEKYGWAIRGQDIEASMSLSLEDVYSSAVKTIELEIEEKNSFDFSFPRRKRYDIKIPEGTKNGTKIRLAGQGENGQHGGQDGDLLLTISILPHPVFTVQDFDLETTIKIETWQAALGAEISVPTMDGPLKIQLPPSTVSGKRLRLRNRGLLKKGRYRGDQFVKIEIGFPKFHSLEERKAYETLKKISLLKKGKPKS